MPTIPELDTVADHQAQWSQTADHLKDTVDRARWIVLALSVAGALAATIASQMPATLDGQNILATSRTWVAIIGATSLAAATFLTSRFLGSGDVRAWIRARVIAEGLKREAYKFATGVAPSAVLVEQQKAIEDDGNDLDAKLVRPTRPGSTPRAPLSQADYEARRVQAQKDFFRDKSTKYRRIANRLKGLEFTAALVATLITAAATVVEKHVVLYGVPFDLAAVTAVLTTIGASILAHIEASRLEYLIASYSATARRLDGMTPKWPDRVTECEAILQEENGSWMSKWTK
jgi:hypothetical protein